MTALATETHCRAPVHRTVAAIREHGCQCDPRRSRALRHGGYYQTLRASLGMESLYVSPLGSRRRLQALAVADWPDTAISQVAGITDRTVWEIRNGARPDAQIFWRTHEAIKATYEQLECEPGPDPRVGRRVAGKGWHSPEAWYGLDMDDPAAQPVRAVVRPDGVDLDPAMVVQLCAPEPASRKPTKAERLAAVAVLTWRDRQSASDIGARIGLTMRQVVRDRMDVRALGLLATSPKLGHEVIASRCGIQSYEVARLERYLGAWDWARYATEPYEPVTVTLADVKRTRAKGRWL